MKIDRVDHIGIAVPSLDAAQPFWEDSLGLVFHGREYVADQQVTVAMGAAGETHIELLEPADPASPIARFLEKNRPGIHHIALHVDNLEEALARLTAQGATLIDQVPRLGAGGKRIAFVHPKSTSGVLLELCEG
ncbi:MAG: methylmalonyl-CoA epimerase [Candidatus Delongbacteria bacterium]